MNMKRTALLYILCLLFSPLGAQVKLPAFFADNIVLQQQSECNLWVWAETGKKVSISTSWDKKD